MSIQSEINRISGNVAEAYSALSAKGAAMPSVLNTDNLKSTIESIQGGEAMSIETIRAICYAPPKFEEKYTLLDYIESTGTQYIDTGFVPNQDTRVVCKAVFSVGTTARFLFGARQSTSSRQFMFAASSVGCYTSGYGSASTKFDAKFNSDNPIVVDKNKAVTTLTLSDGTSGQVNGTVSTFTAPNNMVLFGCNTAGTVAKSTARIYSCQIYDNGTLVRDFVPCIKKSSGAAGLYDRVSQRFFGNRGTDSFIAGHKLPDGYTRLSYIESTGTQYIDTGFVPNQDTRMVVDFEVLSGNTSESHISSARTKGSTPLWTLYYSGGKYGTRYGTGAAQTISSPTGEGRHLFDKNKNVLSIDGTVNKTVTYETFSVTSTLAIFCRNDGTAKNGYIKGRVYSYSLYDNGTLVRNFTPCVNPDGACGLYDMENNQFYVNAGSGAFTGG